MPSDPATDTTPLGIIAFGGTLPIAVAGAVAARGRPVFVLALHGLADPGVAAFPHDWVRFLEIGRGLRLLRGAGCAEVVLAGTMIRPRLSAMRIDLGTLRQLALILAANVVGDDRVLTRVTQSFEREGLRVRGIADVAPELVAPLGALTRRAPNALDEVRFGFEAARVLGAEDIGQAVVVHGRRVVAVEAAEGTTAMVERVSALRANGRFAVAGKAGVLVKAPKPQQELRNDMPALGPDTVTAAAAAGLKGVAYLAGGVLLIETPRMIAIADEAGLWLAGFTADGRLA